MNIWNFPLTKDNCIFYAISSYNNGIGTWSEFFDDIKLFGKLSKYILQNNDNGKIINTRILLNTAISLANVFPKESLARLVFYHSDEQTYSKLKTLLYFMYRLPSSIPEVDLSKIQFDSDFLRELKKL